MIFLVITRQIEFNRISIVPSFQQAADYGNLVAVLLDSQSSINWKKGSIRLYSLSHRVRNAKFPFSIAFFRTDFSISVASINIGWRTMMRYYIRHKNSSLISWRMHVYSGMISSAFYSDIELAIANALVHYKYLRDDDISDEKILKIRHKYVFIRLTL